MTKPWTVQCSYMSHVANTVTVEADTLEEALEKAIEAANEDPGRLEIDRPCQRLAYRRSLRGRRRRPVGGRHGAGPDRFTERGEPPVVTLTGPVPPGAVEVSGGKVLVRISTEAGTVSSEVCDPPHPPANKPLVTVSVEPDGKPRVEVTGGKARIRIVD